MYRVEWRDELGYWNKVGDSDGFNTMDEANAYIERWRAEDERLTMITGHGMMTEYRVVKENGNE